MTLFDYWIYMWVSPQLKEHINKNCKCKQFAQLIKGEDLK